MGGTIAGDQYLLGQIFLHDRYPIVKNTRQTHKMRTGKYILLQFTVVVVPQGGCIIII
jgi:hypothetical protein